MKINHVSVFHSDEHKYQKVHCFHLFPFSSTVGWRQHSRPLGKVALVSNPALLIGADCVADIGTPGHVGKDLEQILQLIWRQSTVSILQCGVRKGIDSVNRTFLVVRSCANYHFSYMGLYHFCITPRYYFLSQLLKTQMPVNGPWHVLL